MVSVRWAILVLVALAIALPSVHADLWGCCIPPHDACFNGAGAYGTQQEFQDACDAIGGNIKGAGTTDSCGFTECTTGCCCAGADVVNSAQINNQEDVLETTKYMCSIKDQQDEGTFTFSPRTQSSCVAQCGGTAPPATSERYTVSGNVVNGSSSKPLKDVKVFIPLPGGAITDYTDTAGEYTLHDVPPMQGIVYAIYPFCKPGQSDRLLVDSDKTGIDLALDCNLQGCKHNPPRILDAKLVRGTDEASLDIDIENACGDLLRYEPYRCDDRWKNCQALPPTTSPLIIDRGLAPETTYCYNITARFSDGTSTSSPGESAACITTGDAECMDLPQGRTQWCGLYNDAPAVVTCDEDNKLDPTQQCQSNELCTTSGGELACVPAPDCSKCNGLLGLFAKLGIPIPNLGQDETCDRIEYCFESSSLASKPLMVDAYASCSAIASCGQYTSQSSCEANRCDVSDTCTWLTIDAELGKGICTGATRPSCSSCDDALGYCTKEACEAISPECYFDAQANGLSQGALGCLDKTEMACRYYDTRSDCIGGGDNARIDIQYTDGERSGGTNGVTSPSQDALGLGVCSWNDDAARCYKDADMHTIAQNDDCIESGLFARDPLCVRDVTPPNTTIYLQDPPVYGRAALRTIPIAVYDDTSSPREITTHVCFAAVDPSSGQITRPCYPHDTLRTMTLPEEGTYRLQYFSEDANQNSEPVRCALLPGTSTCATLQVRDYGEATITAIRVAERS